MNMCQRQIKMMIDDYDEIPFKVIRVLCGRATLHSYTYTSRHRCIFNSSTQALASLRWCSTGYMGFLKSGFMRG